MNGDREKPGQTQSEMEQTEREASLSRRALLRAGWVAPVVTVVALPALAADGSPPPHTDHSDALHPDHGDTAHGDVTHTDTPISITATSTSSAVTATSSISVATAIGLTPTRRTVTCDSEEG